MLIGASVLMLAVVLLGAIGRTLGALFLALLAAYTIYGAHARGRGGRRDA